MLLLLMLFDCLENLPYLVKKIQIFTVLQVSVRTGPVFPVSCTAGMETNAFLWLCKVHPALGCLLLLVLFLPDHNLLKSFQIKHRM